MRSVRCLVVVLALSEDRADAHSGGIAVAYPDDPMKVVVVDGSFTFTWRDSDMLSGTSTATIDWFYTDTIPPTVALGTFPPGLEGTPIALGVPEPDPTNELEWNTSTVAAGAYWIWSIVNEPPSETGSAQLIGFSPAVVVVAHPGDDVRPAIAILDPDAPFRFADQRYAIRYSVLDPDGSGRASLVAYRDGSSDEPIVLSDALPLGDGSYEWDTSALPAGAWALRATIEDARGYSFTAYSRFFLTIGHTQVMPPTEEGCSCTASSTSSSAAIVILMLLILTLRRQRLLRR